MTPDGPEAPQARWPTSRASSLLDELCELEQALRAAGLPHAAAQVHAATRNMRNARDRIARDAAETPPEGWDHGVDGDAADGERLVTCDGRATGFLLAPEREGVGRLRRLAGAVEALPAIAPHDLGWDLLQDRDARHLAQEDVSAGLLARALSQVGWTSAARRSRWATSAIGAGTVVRLMREGRPVAPLAPGGHLLDAEVLDLAERLGWRPELRG